MHVQFHCKLKLLEAAGACPLRFFFRYGLEIAPPEEARVEPGRWLDPLARGSLLHELFEDFVRELAEGGRAPEAGRDRARLLELLDAKIAAARETQPPPSEATFARERRELARTAETFLRADAEHCRAAASVPAWLEASLGMPPGPHATAIDTPDAVPVGLPGGAIRTRGRVDRIDRAGGAYAIWDYKTGSPRSYEGADPFREGRHLQPYLYIPMVERRLREAVDRGATVASFGYFFPGFRFAGRRIAWPAGEPYQFSSMNSG